MIFFFLFSYAQLQFYQMDLLAKLQNEKCCLLLKEKKNPSVFLILHQFHPFVNLNDFNVSLFVYVCVCGFFLLFVRIIFVKLNIRK